MSLIQKFSKLSVRARAWWVLAVIFVFAIAVGLTAGGHVYNNWSKNLAKKTNDIVVLPVIKELPYNLGLDLQGGAHLVYSADVSTIAAADRADAMESVRDVIERRVNAFGVSEPLVQVNKSASGEYRIIAELAGIKDIKEAIKTIGDTPILEFKEQGDGTQALKVDASGTAVLDESAVNWKNTELTGKYLKRSSVQFNPNDGSPEVSLEFNAEGAKLFEEITARNVGKPVAIFLDGYAISTPNVNEKITGGQASISGRFNVEEAKLLVKRLNSGALPVPITLISQKTVEASLGSKSIDNSMMAGLIGLLLVSIFMILYYRLPGLLSVLSLLVYGLTVLAIFKALPIWLALALVIVMIGLVFYTFSELKIFNGTLAFMFIVIGLLLFFYALRPITLSLSGVAGFILSIGIAVDANILIFSRTREELKAGKSVRQAVEDGFKRAWPSIRDGNVSIIITCLILMFFGTSAVQGFGTTLFIGTAISLFSAIVITHTLFVIILGDWMEKRTWLLGVRRSAIENK
ncbi:MAG: preprotein translocase subunit SecD [Patescibacteria group bacterium]|jgi:protein-export membrane protein SecD